MTALKHSVAVTDLFHSLIMMCIDAMEQRYGTVRQLAVHVRKQLNCFWPVTLMKTELVEKALKEWLPAPNKFDRFACEAEGPPEENGKTKLNTKDTATKSQKR